MSWNRTNKCNHETILLIQRFELKYNSEVMLTVFKQISHGCNLYSLTAIPL